ncbi:MAG: hypothetical protein R2688_02360 [Fimbriimonadaceae bacterium]
MFDAGTEVNDEIPMNTAFLGQMMPDTGTPEGGVVGFHQGFMPGGNILGSSMFSGADFTAQNYKVARITVDAVPEPATMAIFGWLVLQSPHAAARNLVTHLCTQEPVDRALFFYHSSMVKIEQYLMKNFWNRFRENALAKRKAKNLSIPISRVEQNVVYSDDEVLRLIQKYFLESTASFLELVSCEAAEKSVTNPEFYEREAFLRLKPEICFDIARLALTLASKYLVSHSNQPILFPR